MKKKAKGKNCLTKKKVEKNCILQNYLSVRGLYKKAMKLNCALLGWVKNTQNRRLGNWAPEKNIFVFVLNVFFNS